MRHHYHLWQEPLAGKSKKVKFYHVCGAPACEEAARNDPAFMPLVIETNMEEWVRFVFVRGSLTEWSTSGVTMDESLVALRERLEGHEARILEGLAELKKSQHKRNAKIYDPFFRDYCAQRAVTEFKLLFARGDYPGIWFLAVAAVMRLNRNLVFNYIDLWFAINKHGAQTVLERCVDKNSITQLGITSFETYKRDLLHLWEDSRRSRWKSRLYNVSRV